MKKATMKTGLGSLALLPGLAMAAPAVADKADNAFYDDLHRAGAVHDDSGDRAVLRRPDPRQERTLHADAGFAVTFALVCVLWVVFTVTRWPSGEGNAFFGNVNWAMLKNIED